MRILFPTDFSPSAEQAFVYALQFARATGATITTVHAYQLPDIRGVSLPNTLRQIYDSMSLEEFENFKDKVPALHAIAEKCQATNVQVSHAMVEGEPKNAILRAIADHNIDLVIMGTTGAGVLKEMFLGSVAAEVMENASVPVLAIPREARFTGLIRKVALAAAFTAEDEQALPKVRDIADMFGAKLSCFNADVSHTMQYTDKVEQFRKKFPEVDFHVVPSTDMEQSIREYIRDHEIDILAMVIHQRGRIRELFEGSITKRIVYRSDTPILAIQAHTL